MSGLSVQEFRQPRFRSFDLFVVLKYAIHCLSLINRWLAVGLQQSQDCVYSLLNGHNLRQVIGVFAPATPHCQGTIPQPPKLSCSCHQVAQCFLQCLSSYALDSKGRSVASDSLSPTAIGKPLPSLSNHNIQRTTRLLSEEES